MDNWLNHVAASDEHSTLGPINISRNGNSSLIDNGEYKWKDCVIDLENQNIISQIEAKNQVFDPLKLIDVRDDGIHIWRVKSGGLEHWRREDYGRFYDKECFLLLHIRDIGKHDERCTITLHLWAGRWAKEETYQLAVHLTIYMNGRLDNRAVVHREIQDKESSVFKAHFPFITYLKGSAEENYWNTARVRGMYQTHLLKCYRPDPRFDHYKIKEVPARNNQLNNSFVYILDRGQDIYQWNGELCMAEDVFKASKYVQDLRGNRGMAIRIDTINDNGEDEGSHPFYMFLSHRSYVTDVGDVEDEQRTLAFPSSRRAPGTPARGYMFRVSSHNGRVQFKKTKEGIITMRDVIKETTCVIDLGDLCILWFSESVELKDRARGIATIHEYIRHSRQPLLPAIVITQGQMSSEFTKALQK